MGIENEYFIFYGVKSADYKEFADDTDESYRQFFKDRKNFIVTDNKQRFKTFALTDGMSGDYSCYGILYNRYGQDRWGEDRPVNEEFSDEDMSKLKQLFYEELERSKIDIGDLEPKLHILYHTT